MPATPQGIIQVDRSHFFSTTSPSDHKPLLMAEASELGLPPECWPYFIGITGPDHDGILVHFNEWVHADDGELLGAYYVGAGVRVQVLND